jgi:type I restriction enzyme S subunit
MELKPEYKQTEAGVIPENWTVMALGTAVERYIDYRGRTPRKLGFSWGGGNILALSANNVQMGRIDLAKEANFGSDELYRRWMTRGPCELGDVLITTEAPLGNIAQVPDSKEYILSQRVLLLKPKEILLRNFLAHFMRGSYFQSRLFQNSSGSTAIGIQRRKLDDIPIYFPTNKFEQSDIADALSDADALIESLEQLLVKKRQMKQGAMQELLTGRKRLPGFTKEWEIKPVADVAPLQRGFDLPTRQIHQGPYPVVYSNGILAHHTKYQAKAPGVVTGRSGTIGKVTFVSEDYWPHNTSLWVTDFKGNDPRLIFYLFILMDLERFSTGSGVPTLNRNDVHAYRINIPQDAEEQSAIANVLSDMDAEIAAFEAKLAKARQIKQGMMQELLTGRIRLVRPSAQILSFPAKESASATDISHNTHFNEAVVIAVLSAKFGSEAFPLGRFRRTKFSYLLHRHVEHEASGFMKKAAGPYNPRTRYGGAEKIALQNRYVRVLSTGKSEGFAADENIAQAEGYFDKWYGAEALTWLEQFRYQKNDSLELLTTVDMACEDLSRVGKAVTLSAVKQIIHDSPEWKAKLNRAVFSDDNIATTIQSCGQLFPIEEE